MGDPDGGAAGFGSGCGSTDKDTETDVDDGRPMSLEESLRLFRKEEEVVRVVVAERAVVPLALILSPRH
jgi:hypothetical protein